MPPDRADQREGPEPGAEQRPVERWTIWVCAECGLDWLAHAFSPCVGASGSASEDGGRIVEVVPASALAEAVKERDEQLERYGELANTASRLATRAEQAERERDELLERLAALEGDDA